MPLIPDQFAATGLHATRVPGAKITRFQVLGERSSGTNLVKRLLGRNSDLEPSEALGWKHGFPGALAIPADLAVICVLRRADDWALSMHAKPWHGTPAMQALPFAQFIRAPWETVIDRPRYFPGQEQVVGQPLQQDRDPVTGRAFANLFALRRAKMEGLLSYLGRNCTCVLLRMESITAQPNEITNEILKSIGANPRKGPFRPVVKRLGSRFKPAIDNRPATPDRFADADRLFLAEQVDSKLEASLGYTY